MQKSKSKITKLNSISIGIIVQRSSITPSNLNNLSSLESIISSNRIRDKDTRKLRVLHRVLLKQFLLSLIVKYIVLVDKFMLSDISHQLSLLKDFNS